MAEQAQTPTRRIQRAAEDESAVRNILGDDWPRDRAETKIFLSNGTVLDEGDQTSGFLDLREKVLLIGAALDVVEKNMTVNMVAIRGDITHVLTRFEAREQLCRDHGEAIAGCRKAGMILMGLVGGLYVGLLTVAGWLFHLAGR